MQRYLAHISYAGTNYRGWQRQKGVVSVQETLENALQKISGIKTNAIGCGRTDSGVHASQYFFHFETESLPLIQTHRLNVKENDAFKYILNKELPNDISVFDILQVKPNFHAQHHALTRTYDYFFHTVKDPYLANTSALYLNLEFDIDLMQEALALIPIEAHDFRAFCTTPEKHNSTICKVESVQLISSNCASRFRLTITADRFLRSMVRTLAGKLIELGNGRMCIDEFKHHLTTGAKFKFQNQAYPQGLYLSQIKYPQIMINRKGAMPEF